MLKPLKHQCDVLERAPYQSHNEPRTKYVFALERLGEIVRLILFSPRTDVSDRIHYISPRCVLAFVSAKENVNCSRILKENSHLKL